MKLAPKDMASAKGGEVNYPSNPPAKGGFMPKPTTREIIAAAMATDATHALTLKPNPDRGDVEPGEHLNYRTGELSVVPGRRVSGSDGRRPRREVSREQLEHLLTQVIIRIHSRTLGRKSRSRKYDGRRVTGYAILEDLPDNGHLHLILRVPGDLVEPFEAMFAKEPSKRETTIWAKLCPGGTSHLTLAGDPVGWAAYCGKRLRNFARIEDYDNLIPVT